MTDLWDINQAGTFYADWDIFGSLSDDSPNFSFGLRTASVTETGGQAFITGGGNIYRFAAVTSFTTTLSTGEEAIEGTRTVGALQDAGDGSRRRQRASERQWNPICTFDHSAVV